MSFQVVSLVLLASALVVEALHQATATFTSPLHFLFWLTQVTSLGMYSQTLPLQCRNLWP